LSPFPELRITRDGVSARGSFAEAQAAYLNPDAAAVSQLDRALAASNVGVVAHYYMDPELQGVLSACAWPHIHISDSLAMADRALRMVQAGAAAVCVAGVDFMSENVRAVLDAGGFADVPVYRLAASHIGCSLAEAAERAAYDAFLDSAARMPPSLHVVYINTSLRTKAAAHAKVPTITCTSGNVVQTLVAAATALPGAHVWYGPDTYMGENLRVILDALAAMDPALFAQRYPGVDRGAVAGLRQRFHPFQQGNCIVHHLFGSAVVAQVLRDYADCLIAAHLEVPGEMFALAATAERAGRGVVGSTSNILDFLVARTREGIAAATPGIRCVLGTEAGMVTSIVVAIQALLRQARSGFSLDIVFPVAAEAIARTDEVTLPVVPGVAGGEGCSTSGGCATCPYMKMNSLDALQSVVELSAQQSPSRLAPYAVKVGGAGGGAELARAGAQPILHMREFQRTGRLPQALVDDVYRRASGRATAAL